MLLLFTINHIRTYMVSNYLITSDIHFDYLNWFLPGFSIIRGSLSAWVLSKEFLCWLLSEWPLDCWWTFNDETLSPRTLCSQRPWREIKILPNKSSISMYESILPMSFLKIIIRFGWPECWVDSPTKPGRVWKLAMRGQKRGRRLMH